MIIVPFTSGLGNQLFQYNLKVPQTKFRQEKFYTNSLLPPKQISIWDIFNNDIN